MTQNSGNIVPPIAAGIDNRIKPYAGLSHQRLTDLINRINSTQRVEGVDFSYGTPITTVGIHNENTVIRLTPMPGTYYEAPADVYYTRLSLEVLNRLPADYIRPAVITQFPFWIASALPQINEALGLNLIASEVQNIQYNAPQDTYELRIVENSSVAWKPSVYYFKIVSGYDISNYFEYDYLDGFDLASTDINTLLPSVLDGFDYTPDDINLLIPDKLDGFDWTTLPIASFIQDKLDGFDRVIVPLDTVIQDKVSGFAATPEIGSTLDNLLFTMRPQESHWSGTKVSSFVDGSHLVPDSQETWDTTVTSWDVWTTWDGTPYTVISYSQTLDMNSVRNVRVVSDAAVDVGTAIEIQYKTSTDGINYTPVANVGQVISARYIDVTWIARGNNPILYSAITDAYSA